MREVDYTYPRKGVITAKSDNKENFEEVYLKRIIDGCCRRGKNLPDRKKLFPLIYCVNH